MYTDTHIHMQPPPSLPSPHLPKRRLAPRARSLRSCGVGNAWLNRPQRFTKFYIILYLNILS